MKIISKLRQRIRTLLTAPGDELGRWAKLVKINIQLWRLCGRRLHEHNAMAMSAALSFRTLFAMIPVLVLSLLVLKSVGVVEKSDIRLSDILEGVGFSQIQIVTEKRPARESFKDASTSQLGEQETQRPRRRRRENDVITVSGHIEKLVKKIERKLTLGKIGPIGVVLLIWTALTLLTTIERSLNRIFAAPRSRSLVRRILVYWSVLTLVPVAMAGAIYAGKQIMGGIEDNDGVSWIVSAAIWIGPVIIGLILLAAIYSLMPNTRVPFRAAAGGAIVALPLWLVARWGFGLYVSEVGKNSLYGALGLLPIFLLYLNLSWLIFLFGAELAHAAISLSGMNIHAVEEGEPVSYSRLLGAAFAVAQPYSQGSGPVSMEQIAAALDLPESSVGKIMTRLRAIGIVYPVESDLQEAYVLARPAEKISLLELMEISTVEKDLSVENFDLQISQRISRVEGLARESLGKTTLAEVI